jgi:MFS family permease
MLAAPTTAYVISKYGSKVSSVLGSIALIFLAIIIGIPSNVWVLAIGVTLQGFGMGWTDVSLNQQVFD